MGTGSSFYFPDDSGCVSSIFLNAILKCKSNRASLRLKFIEWFPAAYKINLNCVLWLCTIWLLSMRVLLPSPHPWLGSHSPELYKKLLICQQPFWWASPVSTWVPPASFAAFWKPSQWARWSPLLAYLLTRRWNLWGLAREYLLAVTSHRTLQASHLMERWD